MEALQMIADTQLPEGYDGPALYLRRAILDARLGMAAQPLRRSRMLDQAIQEIIAGLVHDLSIDMKHAIAAEAEAQVMAAMASAELMRRASLKQHNPDNPTTSA